MPAEETNKTNSTRETKPVFSVLDSEVYGFSGTEKQPGQILGSFRIEKTIGRGAGGIVYLAYDLKLERHVAIKTIPVEKAAGISKELFYREARILASLNHPHIAAIHDVFEEPQKEGYLVLEYVEGKTLAGYIKGKSLPWSEAVTIALQITEGLSVAHRHGIVHRDLKPGNIALTPENIVKILDFGIAQRNPLETSGEMKGDHKPGRITGTPGYMSPEQAQGNSTDHRSDIWALGCILYEMLTSHRAFEGDTISSLCQAVCSQEPDWSKVPSDIPGQLLELIQKCLSKDIQGRWQSCSEIESTLKKCQAIASSRIINIPRIARIVRKPQVAIPLVLIGCVIAIMIVINLRNRAKVKWSQDVALPQIVNMVNQEHYAKAFTLAQEIDALFPQNPVLIKLWPKMSLEGFTILSEPPGASVSIQDYSAPEDKWIRLGMTPIEKVRLPIGLYRWQISKSGYETIHEVHLVNTYMAQSLKFSLMESSQVPQNMIPIPAGVFRLGLTGYPPYDEYSLGSFFIDKYEVTNREYSEFIQAGGYQNPTYWKHGFIRDGQPITWEHAISFFRDQTGQPGPSTWKDGNFPSGQEDFPVQGVSWYEAEAYAQFRGKQLPTIYHWCRVGEPSRFSAAIGPLSNFDSDAPCPVGFKKGISVYGAYDMAGNVREWGFNASDNSDFKRFILGGSWKDPDYMYSFPVSITAFDRSEKNGFRCMKLSEESNPEEKSKIWGPREHFVRDIRKTIPITDQEFDKIRRSFYSYDPAIPLESKVENVDDSNEDYRKEKVSIRTAYNERMNLYIFIPKNNWAAPYQTILIFPPLSAFQEHARSDDKMYPYVFQLQIGRAIVMPVFKGMYERGPLSGDLTLTANIPLTSWVKDWSRTIDYLETRPDIDIQRLAYVGWSLGGVVGSLIPATQNQRFKVCQLYIAGIPTWEIPPPEYDMVNYLPRLTIPVYICNGRYDPTFPLDTSQRPMFDLIGTPDEDKHIFVISEGAHGGWVSDKGGQESLQFMDRYLGKPIKSILDK